MANPVQFLKPWMSTYGSIEVLIALWLICRNCSPSLTKYISLDQFEEVQQHMFQTFFFFFFFILISNVVFT